MKVGRELFERLAGFIHAACSMVQACIEDSATRRLPLGTG